MSKGRSHIGGQGLRAGGKLRFGWEAWPAVSRPISIVHTRFSHCCLVVRWAGNLEVRDASELIPFSTARELVMENHWRIAWIADWSSLGNDSVFQTYALYSLGRAFSRGSCIHRIPIREGGGPRERTGDRMVSTLKRFGGRGSSGRWENEY